MNRIMIPDNIPYIIDIIIKLLRELFYIYMYYPIIIDILRDLSRELYMFLK